MNLLNFEHISKTFEDRTLLNDAVFGVQDKDKIGVIGVNGTGKSTLLSIAAGVLEPDEGKVVKNNGLRISYLPQNPEFDESKTLLENVVERISGKEAHWDVSGEAKAMLLKFGLADAEVNPKILSGGQKKRAALAAALLTPADLMILDEPTNHLDHAMIEYLQTFLNGFQGAILLVTHDRYFLDQVTNQILEIDKGKLYRYETNYSGYLELRAERLNDAVAKERRLATLYRKDLAWISRGARARSTKQKAHIQRFEALRDREKIVEEREMVMQSISSRLGNKTIELDRVSMSYDGRKLFSEFSYIFGKLDRIGIIGPNGCGKSTLLKIIAGIIEPETGTVERGQTVVLGYFGQENEELPTTGRVIDIIRDEGEFVRTTEGLISAAKMCETFLFDGNMQYTPVNKLSGGEKRRLYLLKVLMTSPNVLILDEPTNDLDIQTLRVLEDYLDTFEGIVITVSHDRYFLDRVVNRIFSFELDGTIAQSEGSYEDYRERNLESNSGMSGKLNSAGGIGNVKKTPENGKLSQNEGGKLNPAGENAKKVSYQKLRGEKKKLSYKEQREYDNIEAEIDALQERSDALAKEMEENASIYGKLQQLSEEKEKVDAEIEEKMERYLELEELVQSFQEK